MAESIPGTPRSSKKPVAQVGRSCWRRQTAQRAAALVDADRYFQWLTAAARAARRTLYITGWDQHADVALERSSDGAELKLAEFLNGLVEERPHLQVRVLLWDFATLYLFERETLPFIQARVLDRRTHPRVHIALDSAHPLGASQHQKLVIVDDRLAFCGGIDLGCARWDTRDHAPHDARRRDAAGRAYPPFHDVQLAVEGAPAAELGHLYRRRWQRATDEQLSPPEPQDESEELWPDDEQVTVLSEVSCAIARTLPEWRQQPEIQEIRQFYLDAIASADRTVYLENQYLTAPSIADAIAARLEEKDGPEVVLLTPLQLAGWLEDRTLGVRRRRILEQLWAADHHNRFRVYYPVNSDGEPIYVHAKVAVVDDRLLHVGSANLSNRSLGLDSECDLTLEALGRTELQEAIGQQRNDLLAEHLGVDRSRVAEAVNREGGLIAAVEELQGQGRTLRPLQRADLGEYEVAIDFGLADPERPVAAEAFFKAMRWEAPHQRRWRAILPLAAALVWSVALALLWRYTALGPWLKAHAHAAGSSAGAGLQGAALTLAFFTLGGLLVVPVTVLIVVTVAIYGPALGVPYALLGMAASTVLLHLIGRTLLRNAATKLLNPERAASIAQHVESQRLWMFAALRLVPTAPFSIVNVVAGALNAPRWRFLAGTVLGSLPATITLALLVDRTRAVIEHPWWLNILSAAAVMVLLFVGLRWLRRRVAS